MAILVKEGKFLETRIIDIKNLLNDVQIKIIELLKKQDMFPIEIAKKLKINEQDIYYNIRKLEKIGLIKVSKIEKVRNIKKYYSLSSDSISLILRENWKAVKRIVDERYLEFFRDFIVGGKFSGSIVVGAPFEHGPYLTVSRDGHYAVQLAFFLGSFIDLPKKFVIKLDTEVKAEEAFHRNLILIGGPITNVITYEINRYLPVKFEWKTNWRLISKDKVYSNEFDGVIEKIKNPKDKKYSIILLAGLHAEGTKAAILGLTQQPNKILNNFENYKVIKGIDRDGDGKVDDVKIIEEG